jgi:hypothetical protein
VSSRVFLHYKVGMLILSTNVRKWQRYSWQEAPSTNYFLSSKPFGSPSVPSVNEQDIEKCAVILMYLPMHRSHSRVLSTQLTILSPFTTVLGTSTDTPIFLDCSAQFNSEQDHSANLYLNLQVSLGIWKFLNLFQLKGC